MQMQEQEPFKLEVVSIRLVKDAPLFSDHKIISPADAVEVVGDFLCEIDREVMCIINLKSDGTPINCNIVSIGAVSQTIAVNVLIVQVFVRIEQLRLFKKHCK